MNKNIAIKHVTIVFAVPYIETLRNLGACSTRSIYRLLAPDEYMCRYGRKNATMVHYILI